MHSVIQFIGQKTVGGKKNSMSWDSHSQCLGQCDLTDITDRGVITDEHVLTSVEKPSTKIATRRLKRT